jgi:hypothetical protein
VLHDEVTGTILAARDPVGTRPLYYQRHGDRLRFGFSLAPFADRTRFSAEVNPGWLAANLENLAPPPGTTAFRDVWELLPGQLLLVRDGLLSVSDWHTFEPPPDRVSAAAAESLLADYGQAVRRAADVRGQPAAVEVGISLAATTLLVSALDGRPPFDLDLWGVGFATFDRDRDLLLGAARAHSLAGADVIAGWPGRGLMWRDWYRTGARAVGQPSYHSDLMVKALLDPVAEAGRSVLLAGALDGAFGWAFQPPARPTGLGPRAAARARLRRLRGDVSEQRAKRRPWQPGPLLNPSAAAEFDLPALARSQQAEPTAGTRNGYASLTSRGLAPGLRERLVAWSQIGRHLGVEVTFPLFAPDAVRTLLAMPRALNSLGKIPGGATRAIIGTEADDTDWLARRWRGVERSKAAAESAANGVARRGYLRDNLHPLLMPLLNMDALGERLDGRMRAPHPATQDNPSPHRRSVEFAQIEAINYWLDEWSIA